MTVILRINSSFALLKRLIPHKLVIMYQSIINTAAIEEWISNDLSEKTVESNLISKGYEAGTIKEYICEYKRLKRSKNFSFAFMVLTIGVQIGLVLCFVAKHKS